MRITIEEIYKSLTMFFLTAIFFMTSEFFDGLLIVGSSGQNNSLAQFGSIMIVLSLISIQ